MEIVGTSRGHKTSTNHVNELAESMKVEMESLRPFSDECCIYRVPEGLRELNEKAYTPRVVSIGPFHHGEEKFRAMEDHKRLYLQGFLQRTKVSLEEFIKFIEESETRLRNCYAETIKLSSMDFVKMMLLDAVFIIWILLAHSFSDIPTENDRIFGKLRMINYVREDMCLLENQLPFFILDDLLKLSAIINHCQDWSMIKLTCKCLKVVWGSWVTMDIFQTLNASEVEHFVDFLRICQKPSDHKVDQLMKPKTLTTPNVVELHHAGVKFMPMSINGDCWKIHDIKFNIDKGTLEIPQLKIEDTTEILFRNLQAFEQCHCCDGNYVSNYISFINMIIHSPKDVEMLARKGIIENWLRDNDAALSLFHNLCKGNLVNPKSFYFASLVDDLNTYSRMRWHKWKATLKQNYFHNPWAIISVIAAIFLLILTFMQTVCSMIQVA